MHTTHNTSDCHKYEKEGCKKGFGKGQCKSAAPDKYTANAYVQLSEKIVKLKKVSKNLKKAQRSTSVSTTATVMTLTPPEGVCPAAQGCLIVVKISGLITDR
jgi:hypothetical protein